MIKLFNKDIFYKGDLSLLEKPKISIVGTRKPSNYTKLIVANLSRELSKLGFVIVSGAAMGTDAIAHKNAINTIAVMANGLDIRYPKVNEKLITKIEEEHLVLSPFEYGYKARKYSFVLRNELVVLLSDILIIAEADINSGSLTSANYAIKHNKEIFVLPHRLNESKGTFELLKENKAKLILDIDEFISNLAKKYNLNKVIEELDEFLEFCKTNPTYEEAFNFDSQKLFEYEIENRICIKNNKIFVI